MKAITDTLIEYIKESGLKTGARLPSESAIASHLGVTRHQLRNGMELLKKQKVLIQRRGSGTYIK